MHQVKFQLFSETYRRCLREAMEAHPEKYFFPRGLTIEQGAEQTATKMLTAMATKPLGVNYTNSDGFKRTCKALGIKYTVTAIFEYLEIPRK